MQDAIVEVIIPVLIALIIHELIIKPSVIPQIQALFPAGS